MKSLHVWRFVVTLLYKFYGSLLLVFTFCLFDYARYPCWWHHNIHVDFVFAIFDQLHDVLSKMNDIPVLPPIMHPCMIIWFHWTSSLFYCLQLYSWRYFLENKTVLYLPKEFDSPRCFWKQILCFILAFMSLVVFLDFSISRTLLCLFSNLFVWTYFVMVSESCWRKGEKSEGVAGQHQCCYFYTKQQDG